MESYIIHQVFSDFDEFTESARTWDIDFRQLEPGPFKGELIHYIKDTFQFAHARLNRRIEQLGSPPQEVRTFAISVTKHLRLTWCGKIIPEDSVLIFQPSRGLDCISWPDFDMYTFSMPESHIEHLCEVMGLSTMVNVICRSDIIQCSSQSMSQLRGMFKALCGMLSKDTTRDATPWIQETFEQDLPRLLMKTLSSNQETIHVEPKRLRDTVIRQIKQYLQSQVDKSPKVHDLCQMFNISERSLEYAFRELFGMSPQQYLKAYRLNMAHKLLRNKSPEHRRIVDIANRCDFWHMGQFAADYRKLFGQLPSHTFSK